MKTALTFHYGNWNMPITHIISLPLYCICISAGLWFCVWPAGHSLCAPRGRNVMLPEGLSPRRSLNRVDWGRRAWSGQLPTSRARVLWERKQRSLLKESRSYCKGIWMSQCINEAISSLIHKGFVNVCALSAKFSQPECGVAYLFI